MYILGRSPGILLRARSARHARTAWARLVDSYGEVGAFAELAAYAGGSDAAHRVLDRHGIETDLS